MGSNPGDEFGSLMMPPCGGCQGPLDKEKEEAKKRMALADDLQLATMRAQIVLLLAEAAKKFAETYAQLGGHKSPVIDMLAQQSRQMAEILKDE